MVRRESELSCVGERTPDRHCLKFNQGATANSLWGKGRKKSGQAHVTPACSSDGKGKREETENPEWMATGKGMGTFGFCTFCTALLGSKWATTTWGGLDPYRFAKMDLGKQQNTSRGAGPKGAGGDVSLLAKRRGTNLGRLGCRDGL